MLDIFLALTLGLFPGIVLAIAIYVKDHHEPEPLRLLFFSFLLGGLSLLLSLIPSELLAYYLEDWGNFLESEAIHAFATVAFVEEFCKFFIVRWILYPNRHFNEPLDGIVYSVMVGLGFASLENLIYIFRFGLDSGFLRMFSAVPAHAVFAVIMGYYLGIARFSHRHEHWYAALALLSAVFLHGSYDYFLFLSSIPGMWTGALLSLAGASWMAMRSIRLHQNASPFYRKEGTGSEE